MSTSPDPDLIKVTEVFLIPCSFLVAALGTADSNPHRAAVSLLGLIVSAFWWISSHEALAERQKVLKEQGIASHSRRIRVMYALPIFFLLAWILSLVVHLFLWNQSLGK